LSSQLSLARQLVRSRPHLAIARSLRYSYGSDKSRKSAFSGCFCHLSAL